MKNFKRIVAVAMLLTLTCTAFSSMTYAYILQQSEVRFDNFGQPVMDGTTLKQLRTDVMATRPGQSSSIGNNGAKNEYQFSKSPFYWTLFGSESQQITLKSHHRPNSGMSIALEAGEFVWAPSVNRDTATCPKGAVDCTFVSYADLPKDALGVTYTPERCGFITETDSLLDRYLRANGYNRVAWGVYKNNAGEYANVIPQKLVDEWATANGLK